MRFWLFNGLFVISCGYALWRGGRDERICALIFIVGLAGTSAVHGWTAKYQTLVWGVFTIDVLMLLGLAWLALRSDRFWPLWLTAMQTVEVLGHGVTLVGPRVIPWAYRAMISFWSYPMLLILLAGSIRHHRRQTRIGPERFWLNSSVRRLLRILRKQQGG